LGGEQSWIIKTDSTGSKQWDKTLLTNTIGDDEIGLAIQAGDGCYVMANYTQGGIGGDKTQASWGANDYWMIKFCETVQANFTSPTFICPGTCIGFYNLSLQATSYQWTFSGAIPPTSTDVDPTNICYTSPGSYDVQLIASNANGSDTLFLSNYITVYPFPSAQGIIQSGDTLFAIPGSSSYQWYFNGNIISGATNYIYVATQSGDYNVVASDSNGCEVEAVINNVQAAVSPLSFGEGSGVKLFPNPVTDVLKVIYYGINRTTAKISVYNIMGERMKLDFTPLSLGEGLGGEANCELLPSGLYYFEIISGEKIYRTKFLKQ